MKLFLRGLAICYFIGGLLHLADLFDLRLRFSEMGTTWRIWILYLLVFDLIAAIGLWLGRRWGKAFFISVAVSQLIAYIGYPEEFGEQPLLIAFHAVALTAFVFLMSLRRFRVN